MKKRVLSVLLILAMARLLVACSPNPESAPMSEPNPELSAESVTAQEPEPTPELAPVQEPESETKLEDAPSDPNLGVYKATLVEMYGLKIDPSEIYPEGFVIELKEGGICTILSDGESGEGTWSLEDGVLTIDDDASTITGSLSDGVMKVINMLDQGLDITLEKQESRSYAYTDESLSEEYNAEIAATIGDHRLTNAVLQIFYWATVYDDLNENADDLSTRGPDVTAPFAEQNYDETTTWEQHYLQTALDDYLRNVVLYDEATQKGFTVTDVTQERIDAIPANLAAQASENGFSDVEDYLSQSFGLCVNVDDYQEYFRLISIASDYAGTLEDQSDIEALFSKYELKVNYDNLHLFDIVARSIAQDAADAAT